VNILFFPRKVSIPDDLPPSIKVLNFSISEDILIGGYYFLQDENLPTILLFHGNGEVALEYLHFMDLFFECRVNLAVVDFRGYGHSTGTPRFNNLVKDGLPIYTEFIKWIKENDLKNSLFVLGRSLGSAPATEIGAHNPEDLKGVIISSGFGSFSNDTRVKKFAKPTLIIHGSRDPIISVSEAQVNYDAVPDGVDKELIIIEGAGHNDLFDYYKKEYFAPIKEFIEKNK
jgi:pimeloyl-ACP methyl ester carboxylesterase